MVQCVMGGGVDVVVVVDGSTEQGVVSGQGQGVVVVSIGHGVVSGHGQSVTSGLLVTPGYPGWPAPGGKLSFTPLAQSSTAGDGVVGTAGVDNSNSPSPQLSSNLKHLRYT